MSKIVKENLAEKSLSLGSSFKSFHGTNFCRVTFIRRTLKSSGFGAFNGGPNVQNRHFGADLVTNKVLIFLEELNAPKTNFLNFCVGPPFLVSACFCK